MATLVTGAGGFVGRHLCAALRRAGHQVVEALGPGARAPAGAQTLDVCDEGAVRRLIAEVEPNRIVHLAALSSVAQSHRDAVRAYQVNTLGSIHLLNAVKEEVPACRILLVGSGEVYGPVPVGQAANERSAFDPRSPYAGSKAAAEVAALQFHRSYGIPVVMTRSFNHLGPGQARGFVVADFAHQVAEIAKHRAEPVLRTGNLEPIRDFSHVADVVEAYRLLLDVGVSGEAYNVCSGLGRSIRSLLTELLEIAGIRAEITLEPAKVRPVEIASLVGAPSKLEALGFRPSHSVSEGLAQALEAAMRMET